MSIRPQNLTFALLVLAIACIGASIIIAHQPQPLRFAIERTQP